MDTSKPLKNRTFIMNLCPHTLGTLFDQLGLKSTNQAIDDFLATHSPPPRDIPLYKAKFWSNSQASFLKEAIIEDSEWALLADQLDQFLRSSTMPDQ